MINKDDSKDAKVKTEVKKTYMYAEDISEYEEF